MELLKVKPTTLLLYCLINYCNSFIVPNEIPSLLLLIYSNIPPVKVGFDTRFGLGFRLGPHADYQTLIEIGPQTNTNPLNGTASNSQPKTRRGLRLLLPKTIDEKQEKNSTQKGANRPKKQDKTVSGKIEFKKVPGIDDVSERTKSSKNEKVTSGSPTKFVLL